MPPPQDPSDRSSMVMAAWYCTACDVAGRSPTDPTATFVTCWNCGGQVTVTPRPSIHLSEL